MQEKRSPEGCRRRCVPFVCVYYALRCLCLVLPSFSRPSMALQTALSGAAGIPRPSYSQLCARSFIPAAASRGCTAPDASIPPILRHPHVQPTTRPALGGAGWSGRAWELAQGRPTAAAPRRRIGRGTSDSFCLLRSMGFLACLRLMVIGPGGGCWERREVPAGTYYLWYTRKYLFGAKLGSWKTTPSYVRYRSRGMLYGSCSNRGEGQREECIIMINVA